MLPTLYVEGRLTADPEMRFTPAGKAVASFSLATNDRRKNAETDQWEDVDPTFFRVTVWDRLAENCAESLAKGDLVVVHGKLKQRDYTASDGTKRTIYQEITANVVGVSLQFRTVPHGAGKAERKAADPVPDPWATPAADTDQPPF